MEVICIMGSPRINGNSATIAKRFCNRAEQKGAKVQYFYLNEINFRGCQACMACKTKLDRCVLEDGLSTVLEAVHRADILVFASPVYAGGVSGQFKCFLDRTYSFLKPDYITNPKPSRLPPGKKMVIILTQGSPSEERFNDIHPKIETMFRRHGFIETRTIRGCGMRDQGIAETREDLMGEADKTAEEMFRG